jgi:prepilin-type N-terminal cleavage/methylation domain-containing protein
MMRRSLLSSRPRAGLRSARRGMSVIEIIVAITILGIVIAMAGRLTFAVTQYNRANDLRTKRGFAMQQQANFVSSLPFASLNTTVLPATKSFTTGDFSYVRRIAMTTVGVTTKITITLVPSTGIAGDTLQKESTIIVRSKPPCGTVLNVGAC